MDIGTAKPDSDVLRYAPHHLINILDPSESYSAGQFRIDALRVMDDIISRGKTPLLVGGTMLYFRVLQQGIATLPLANVHVRAELKARAEREGWDQLHAELAQIDPLAAKRIHEHDQQRIQRALEVYQLTGKTISILQTEETQPLSHFDVHYLALLPSNRLALHARIAARFQTMLNLGFVDEVKRLYERGDLTADLPALRCVGYREVWRFLEGQLTYEEMCVQSVTATRQLAKRQLTWLRSWPGLISFDSEAKDIVQLMTMCIDAALK
jgi:tRNA dimethylallyltransferase